MEIVLTIILGILIMSLVFMMGAIYGFNNMKKIHNEYKDAVDPCLIEIGRCEGRLEILEKYEKDCAK